MSKLERAKRLHALVALLTSVTARHLDAGNWDRVEVLDDRFMQAEDALSAAQEALSPEEADLYGVHVFGAQAWAERPWAHNVVTEPEPEPFPEPRKHPDKVGFTVFAWKRMLHDTGFSADHTVRPYIFGGSKPERVRIETRTTLTLAFQFYTGHPEVTHMWVQWSDGRRHLVHRKGH
jgi:hypothetical protein